MRYYHFDELNPSVQDAAMLEFREKFDGKLVEMAGVELLTT
jgi:hypothetical protein